MFTMKKTFKSLMIAALGLCALASAQMPTSVLFQGMLTKSGVAVSSNNESLILKVCTAKTGDNCTTVFDGSVVVLNGYYSALMTGLPPMDKPYWIEVVANNTIASARIPLTASPYALRADVADSVAAGAAVTSINKLKDQVTLSVAQNLSMEQSGSNILIKGPSLDNYTGTIKANGIVEARSGILKKGFLNYYQRTNVVDYKRLFVFSCGTLNWHGGLVRALYGGRFGSAIINLHIAIDGTSTITIESASAQNIYRKPLFYYVKTANNTFEVWVAMLAKDDDAALQELNIPFGSADFTHLTSATPLATWTAIPYN
jgi:hypothetical protein